MSSSMKSLLLFFAALALIGATVVGFVSNPGVSSLAKSHLLGASESRLSRASHSPPRQPKFVGPLRAEGDAMREAREKAQRMSEQAASLREEVAAEEGSRGRKASSGDIAQPDPATDDSSSEEAVPKPAISTSMKEKLRKELVSQQADPNQSVGNPILVICGVVAILVILGGKGIFY